MVESNVSRVAGVVWRATDAAVSVVVVQSDHQSAGVIGDRFVAGLTDRARRRGVRWDMRHSVVATRSVGGVRSRLCSDVMHHTIA